MGSPFAMMPLPVDIILYLFHGVRYDLVSFLPFFWLTHSFPNGFVPRHLLLRKRRRGKSNL
jgi:hypothetical protein